MKTMVLVLGFLSLAAEGRQSYDGGETVATTLLEVDYPCILKTWRIRGVRVCARWDGPHACLIIENAYPCGIFEVVRKAGTSHLKEVGLLLGRLPMPTTSSHTGTLQFAEAHVYTFVPPFPFDTVLPLAMPVGPLFQVDYLSEADPLGWRIDWLDRFLLPACVEQAGAWGSYSPRSGFAADSNEVIASYLTALRAGRVANDPRGRFRFAPYDFEPRTGHYLQPIRSSCLAIGSPPRFIETDALSKDGAYFLIHFGIFEVCQGCDPVRLAEGR